MKLNILPLSQRDTRWASKKLGKSTSLTIGTDGCLLTCHAMLLTHFGHECTPDVLNEIYKGKKVFDNALINFYAAGTVYEDFKAAEYYNCIDIPCDLKKIDDLLAKRLPVIAYVDNVNGDKKPDHFVLIIGKSDDGHYFTNDPWTGETYYFDAKWGDPTINIYGLRIYSGTPATNTSNEDKISDLENKIKSLNEQVASLSLENNTLRTDLSTQERDNSDLTDQLNKVRTEKSEIQYNYDLIKNENTELKNGISARDIQIEGLKLDYSNLKEQSTLALSTWELFKLIFRRR